MQNKQVKPQQEADYSASPLRMRAQLLKELQKEQELISKKQRD